MPNVGKPCQHLRLSNAMNPWLTPFYYDLRVSHTQSYQKNIKQCFNNQAYFRNNQSCLTTACLTQVFDNPKSPYAVDVRSQHGKIGVLDELTAIRFRNWRQYELTPYYVPCHIFKEDNGEFSIWLDLNLSSVSGSVEDLKVLMASSAYQEAKQKHLQSQQKKKTMSSTTKLLIWAVGVLAILGVGLFFYLFLPEISSF